MTRKDLPPPSQAGRLANSVNENNTGKSLCRPWPIELLALRACVSEVTALARPSKGRFHARVGVSRVFRFEAAPATGDCRVQAGLTREKAPARCESSRRLSGSVS
jgi:hypothetical protein